MNKIFNALVESNYYDEASLPHSAICKLKDLRFLSNFYQGNFFSLFCRNFYYQLLLFFFFIEIFTGYLLAKKLKVLIV